MAILQGSESIPPEHLMTDDACANCHPDIAKTHEQSMHRFSSFNNPAYRFSVEEAREVLLQRDGTLQASRFCAACHERPVFGGSAGNRTVTVAPAANESGTTTITVRVSDGLLSASDSFILTVNAVNDAPVANGDGPYAAIAGQPLIVGAAAGVLANDLDLGSLAMPDRIANRFDNNPVGSNCDGPRRLVDVRFDLPSDQRFRISK